jgi:MFS family permease
VSQLLPIVVALAFVSGAAYAATTVSAQTALFENMPARVRGRVFGVLASIVSAASLLPILIAGPLADRTSAPLVVAIIAAAVLIVTIWSLLLFGPRPSRAG